MSNKTESKNTHVAFRGTRLWITKERISLNVSRLRVNLACMAGVLTSRPNFKARCARTKL